MGCGSSRPKKGNTVLSEPVRGRHQKQRDHSPNKESRANNRQENHELLPVLPNHDQITPPIGSAETALPPPPKSTPIAPSVEAPLSLPSEDDFNESKDIDDGDGMEQGFNLSSPVSLTPKREKKRKKAALRRADGAPPPLLGKKNAEFEETGEDVHHNSLQTSGTLSTQPEKLNARNESNEIRRNALKCFRAAAHAVTFSTDRLRRLQNVSGEEWAAVSQAASISATAVAPHRQRSINAEELRVRGGAGSSLLPEIEASIERWTSHVDNPEDAVVEPQQPQNYAYGVRCAHRESIHPFYTKFREAKISRLEQDFAEAKGGLKSPSKGTRGQKVVLIRSTKQDPKTAEKEKNTAHVQHMGAIRNAWLALERENEKVSSNSLQNGAFATLHPNWDVPMHVREYKRTWQPVLVNAIPPESTVEVVEIEQLGTLAQAGYLYAVQIRFRKAKVDDAFRDADNSWPEPEQYFDPSTDSATVLQVPKEEDGEIESPKFSLVKAGRIGQVKIKLNNLRKNVQRSGRAPRDQPLHPQNLHGVDVRFLFCFPIVVTVMTGRTIHVMVEPVSTVETLKLQISGKIQLPTEVIEIFLGGEALSDNRKLVEYNIQRNSEVFVSLPLFRQDDLQVEKTRDGIFNVISSESMNLLKTTALGSILQFYKLRFGPVIPCYSSGTSIVIRNSNNQERLFSDCVGVIQNISSDKGPQRGAYHVWVNNTPPLQQITCHLPCWDHHLAQPYADYKVGDGIVLTDKDGRWWDATIRESIADSRYVVEWKDRDIGTSEVTLNKVNHASSIMPMKEYAVAVSKYLESAAKESEFVTDGITGNQLRTLDQLVELEIENVTGALHGIGSLPPEFENVKTAVNLGRALADPETVEFCIHGRSCGVAVLVKAGAGTGKTWLTYQLLSTMALPSTVSMDSRFVPILIRVQSLASMYRKAIKSIRDGTDLLSWYIESKYAGSERQMLLAAYSRRRLLVLLDGIDEASDLKDLIQDFILKKLVPDGHRFLITSRPEGVRTSLWQQKFIVLDLQPYSREQQEAVLREQIDGKAQEFIQNVLDFCKALHELDTIYKDLGEEVQEFFMEDPLVAPFDSTLDKKGKFLEKSRQVNLQGSPVSTVDELLEVARAVQDAFVQEVARIASNVGMRLTKCKEELRANSFHGVILAPLKGEDRCKEKCKQKYAPEIKQRIRVGPAAAWIIDAVRCSVLCASPSEVRQFFLELKKSPQLTVTRVKNYFIHVDPTHYRRLNVTVLLSEDGTRPAHSAEIQIHMSKIYAFKDQHKEIMHRPYEYFRSLFGSQINHRMSGIHFQEITPMTTLQHGNDGWMALDERIRNWSDFLSNPVMMSLFVVVLKSIDFGGMPDFSRLPESKASLYSRAIELFIRRKLDSPESGDGHRVGQKSVDTALGSMSYVNQIEGRREFTIGMVINDGVDENKLEPIKHLLIDNEHDGYCVPTLKVLDAAGAGGPTMNFTAVTMQAIHLSLQEYLCARDLTHNILSAQIPTDKSTPPMKNLRFHSLASLLNNEFYTGVLGFTSKDIPLAASLLLAPISAFGPSFDSSLHHLSRHGLEQFFLILDSFFQISTSSNLQPLQPCLLDSLTELRINGGMCDELAPRDSFGLPADTGEYWTRVSRDEQRAAYCTGLLTLPGAICQLQALTLLEVWNCHLLRALPDSLGQLKSLCVLDIHNCTELETLPKTLVDLESLEGLYVTCSGNLANPLPSEMKRADVQSEVPLFATPGLQHMTEIVLSELTAVTELPQTLGELGSLTKLSIRGCSSLIALPLSIGKLTSLNLLDISRCNSLTTLPSSMADLTELTTLRLRGCTSLVDAPPALFDGSIVHLKTIDVFGCPNLDLPVTCHAKFKDQPEQKRSLLNLCRYSHSLPTELRDDWPAAASLAHVCQMHSTTATHVLPTALPRKDVEVILAMISEARRLGCSLSSSELRVDQEIPPPQMACSDELPVPDELSQDDAKILRYKYIEPLEDDLQSMKHSSTSVEYRGGRVVVLDRLMSDELSVPPGVSLSDAKVGSFDVLEMIQASQLKAGSSVLSAEVFHREAPGHYELLADEKQSWNGTGVNLADAAYMTLENKPNASDESKRLLEEALAHWANEPKLACEQVYHVCKAKMCLARLLDTDDPTTAHQLRSEARAAYTETNRRFPFEP